MVQAFFCLTIAFAQAPQSTIDWKTATDLPNVDLSSLTPAQKKTALEALREYPCLCGCGLKIAECRVKDSGCADSRAFAEIVVKAVKGGKNPEEALANSDRAKLRAAASRVLGDPVVIPIQGAPSKGPAAARITVVEFSDFECPYCSGRGGEGGSDSESIPKDMRLRYKEFPLPSLSRTPEWPRQPLWLPRPRASFGSMHDKLFAHFHGLTPETISTFASEIRSGHPEVPAGHAVRPDQADHRPGRSGWRSVDRRQHADFLHQWKEI